MDSILNSGNVSLLNRSKWLNSITISTTDSSLIGLINSYSFVKNSIRWKKTKSKFSEEKLARDFTKVLPEEIQRGSKNQIDDFNSIPSKKLNVAGFDYGPSFNQVNMINADFLHNLGFRGEGMLIAVLDAGFISADTMAAFDNLFQTNRIIATRNFVDGNDSVFKSATHGTYVLSTMAAELPSLIVGTAPKANYMLFITEDILSETIIEEFNWVSAAEFADSAGADIINSSLGYTTFDDSTQNHTYAEMDGNTAIASTGADIASAKGILVVVSAGNSGNGPWHFIGVPADADSALTIGAVDASKIYASFSSKGPSADGRVKPDVCAQGQGTVIATSNDSITWGSGTSFSSPIMAGAAACFWQSAPGKSNIEIADFIRKSASQYNNPDTLMGYGIPDFKSAYESLTNKIFTDTDSFVIYPNPFTEKLFVDYYSTDKKIISMAVFDVSGKKIMNLEKTLSEGLNRISIEKNSLSGNSPNILQIKNGAKTVKEIVIKL